MRVRAARHGFDPRTHFVKRRFAWNAASQLVRAGAVRRDLMTQRDAHFVERGLVRFASPRVRGEVAARSAAGEGASL